MKNIWLICSMILFSSALLGQERISNNVTVTKDSLTPIQNSLNFNSPKGQYDIQKDERIDKIAAFVRAGEESVEGVKMDGFRVLIFFDMSKSVAEQQKAYFLSMYTQHKAYVDYMAPNYRVRVGNFRTELEAEKLKQELLPLFPTAIVVSDKIQLPNITEPAVTPR